MQLWLGQALYAAGRRGDALKLLLALKAHPDRDVAKVSKELVFILKAPELQLDESSRVGFDMDNFDAEAKFERAPDGTIKIMKRPEFEKPPEYGSVRSRRREVYRCLPCDSWPSHDAVGGFFSDVEAIRTPRRSAKQKEKDDVRKLLDKKPKKAKRKKALEKAPLGALQTADKKSELAPIKAASPVAKKEPTRTGDHLGEVKKEPTRTGGDDADRPPSRTVWKSNYRRLCNNSHVDARTGRARATSSRRRSPRATRTSPRRSRRRRTRLKVY